MLKRVLIITGIGVGLMLMGLALFLVAGLTAPADMSVHGWFAFLLGAFFSILLSVGLYALAFFSARTGRDQISDLSESSDDQLNIRIG